MKIEDLLWERAKEKLYLSKEEFLATLEGWDIVPHYVGEDLAWITLHKGPEIHFQTVGKTRPMPRGRFNAVVQGIIDQHGYAETKTPKDDTRQHRFNRLYGFEAIGEDEFDIHFRITRLRHVRG